MIIEGIKTGRDLAFEHYPNLVSQFNNICICPETMGKLGQLGTLDEVIIICKNIGTKISRPCVDFGHLNARERGKISAEQLYRSSFDLIEKELGKHVVENLHIHYSKIEYTERGEKKHVPNSNDEWGPKIDPLFFMCKENGYHPIIINESPELEPDAVMLINRWETIQAS